MGSISPEIKDFIQNQAKNRYHVDEILPVKVETKPEKYDPKILVLLEPGAGCKFLLYPYKTNPKVELRLNYLSIQSIDTPSPTQMKIQYNENKTLSLSPAESTSTVIDRLLLNVHISLRHIFPNVPLERLMSISIGPRERKTSVWNSVDSVAVATDQPCGGFSNMYACMCDLHGYRVMDEIVWDMNTIYDTQDSHVLYLHDFDHLSASDHVVPLLATLQHNSWFTGIDASKMKLSPDAQRELLNVLRKNTSIEVWNLANTGINKEFAQKLMSSLLANPQSKCACLDLSENVIEDKGLSYIGQAIPSMVHGLQSFNVSASGLNAKSINRLMDGLTQNSMAPNTLHTLNLSQNSLKNDDLLNLGAFLAQPNVLQNLDLSETDAQIDLLIGALSRGCLQHIETLNLSGNPFSLKKLKNQTAPPAWKLFFCSVISLKHVNLTSCKLPPSAIKELLLGLSSNLNSPSVYLNLSCNDMKSEGGLQLGACIAELRNVHGLDLSDNGLDGHLHEILPWFGQNSSIHHLSIGKNFSQLRNKALQLALEKLVMAIQDENCALESLSVADSELKTNTTVIINALGSNSTLKSLDVSGNQMHDFGAKMLAKALTINSTLTSVLWDKNNVTAYGLRDIAQALNRNFSVLDMPLPIADIAHYTDTLRSSQSTEINLIQNSSVQIQRCLQRNHSPQKVAYDNSYRLQQGFIVNSTQTVVDKLVQEIEALLNSEDGAKVAETKRIEVQALLQDADKAKQILVSLQNVALSSESAPNEFSTCLNKISDLLESAVNKQLERAMTGMIESVSTDCPALFKSTKLVGILKSGCAQRSSFHDTTVSALVQNHLAADLQSKISYKNFNMAVFVAETAIDKLVDKLNKHLNMLKGFEVAEISPSPSSDVEEAFDSEIATRSQSENSLLSVSRGSILNRHSVMNTLKRRPQSYFDHLNILCTGEETDDTGACGAQAGDGLKAMAESSDLAEADEPDVSTKQTSASLKFTKKGSTSSEGPTALENGESAAPAPLTHLVKGRPRRPKTHAVKRPVTTVAVETTTDPAEAVDEFFKPPTVSTTVPTPVTKQRTPSTKDKPERPDESPKTKRKSPFGSSSKDKQDADKKRGSKGTNTRANIASGITNFFNRKGKKSVDSDKNKGKSEPDADKKQSVLEKPTVSETAATPVRPERPMSGPSVKSRGTTEDIPETKQPDAISPIQEEIPEINLEKVEPEPEPEKRVAPPKKPIGIGMPGMSPGLLAEMNKRVSKVPAAQPKPVPRPAATGDLTDSKEPPARPSFPTAAKPIPPDASKPVLPIKAEPKSEDPPQPKPTPREAIKPPPIIRPKPPRPNPKPRPASRPVTMDVTHLAAANKEGSPSKPPPFSAKRSSLTETKSKSPERPPQPNTRPLKAKQPDVDPRDGHDSENPANILADDKESKPEIKPRQPLSHPVKPERNKSKKDKSAPTPPVEAQPESQAVLKEDESKEMNELTNPDQTQSVSDVILEAELDKPEEGVSNTHDDDKDAMGQMTVSQGDVGLKKQLSIDLDTRTSQEFSSDVSKRESKGLSSNRSSVLSARLSNGSDTAQLDAGPVLRPPSSVGSKTNSPKRASTPADSGDSEPVVEPANPDEPNTETLV